MEFLPLLIVGFIAGLLTGGIVGGPGTGYLASAVVGVAGTLLGVGVNSLLGIGGIGDTLTVVVLGILGSTVVRLAMLTATATRRLAAARRG